METMLQGDEHPGRLDGSDLPLLSEESAFSEGSPSSHGDSQDVVQFAAPIQYASQQQGILNARLMRIGLLKGQCAVHYHSEDISAKAGVNFESVKGEAVFGEGEDSIDIEVKIIESDYFNTTSEFRLVITQGTNCHLGHYLSKSRVKVIGKGLFPSEKYHNELLEGKPGIDKVGGWRLYLEALKLLFNAPGVGWRSVAACGLDQVQNIYLYATLWISVYLVDTLFKEEARTLITQGPREGRIYTAYLIACIYVVPHWFIWACEVAKSKLAVEARVACFLKLNLFNRYLNYSEHSRLHIGESRMQDTVYQECDKVTAGYMTTIDLVLLLGKAVVLCVFMARKSPSALLAVLTMPFVMLLTALLRAKVTQVASSAVNKADLNFLIFIEDTFKYFSTILEYARRDHVYDNAVRRIYDQEQAMMGLQLVINNNDMFSMLLGPLYVALHIVLNTEKVMEGGMGVGIYVTTIAVYMQFSMIWGQMYKMVIKVMGSHGALENITECFNMATDLQSRYDAAQQSLAFLTRKRISLRGHNAKQGVEAPVTDAISLELEGVCFRFSDRPPLLRDVNLRVSQGSVVAVCGEHGSGKATLMQIFAGLLMPTEGAVVMPSHLRKLYVPQRPVLLNMSAWDNLIFGNHSVKPTRVLDILRDIKMDADFIALVRHDLEELGRLEELSQEDNQARKSTKPDMYYVKNWKEIISSCQAAKLQLARAFIMNPEVIVIQRPFRDFDFQHRGAIVTMIQTHVSEKGCRMPAENKGARRPRTVLFGPSFEEDLRMADAAWLLDASTQKVTVKKAAQVTAKELAKLGLSKEEAATS